MFDDDHLVSCAELVPLMALATLIAAMCARASSIDAVYTPSTIATLLREFIFVHAPRLESVLRAHLAATSQRSPMLPGTDA